jgi:hypothetical protein
MSYQPQLYNQQPYYTQQPAIFTPSVNLELPENGGVTNNPNPKSSDNKKYTYLVCFGFFCIIVFTGLAVFSNDKKTKLQKALNESINNKSINNTDKSNAENKINILWILTIVFICIAALILCIIISTIPVTSTTDGSEIILLIYCLQCLGPCLECLSHCCYAFGECLGECCHVILKAFESI